MRRVSSATRLRWITWSLALVCVTVAVIAVFWLHGIRPDDSVIRVVDATFSDPTRADGSVERVLLPHDWRHDERARDIREARYQLEIFLNVAPNRLWAIYIPSLEMTPAVLVNGTVVGGEPDPSQPLRRYWNRPVMYSIPNGLLRPGTNHLDIMLSANGSWGRLSEVYMGPIEQIQPYYAQRYVWRVTYLNVTATGGLLLALFMIALSLAQRDSTYSWFAGFALGWFLLNTFILTMTVPVSNALWDFWAYVTIGILLSTGSLFTVRFLDLPSPRWKRLILTTAFLGPFLLLPLLLVQVELFNFAGSIVWIGLLLVLSCYPSFLVMRAMWYRQDLEIFFLMVCFLLSVMLGLHDWLVTSGLGYRHNGLMLQFAAAPTLTTLGIILFRRFVAALRETESLNRELEQRVADKALEFEQTYLRNRELEYAQLLSDERERIMRDMHDGVGSQLIGTIGQLDPGDSRDRQISLNLQTALRDLRLMIDSLEDVDDDVVVALGLFRNRIQPQVDAAGLTLRWQIGDLPVVSDLRPERVLHFMRILQEAVTNCIRHSAATELTVSTCPQLEINGRPCVCVSVSDNGIGFEGAGSHGRGMDNMRYRATTACLELEILSSSQGTTIRVGFPTSNAEPAQRSLQP